MSFTIKGEERCFWIVTPYWYPHSSHVNNFNPNMLRSKVGALLAEVPNGRLQVQQLFLKLTYILDVH